MRSGEGGPALSFFSLSGTWYDNNMPTPIGTEIPVGYCTAQGNYELSLGSSAVASPKESLLLHVPRKSHIYLEGMMLA